MSELEYQWVSNKVDDWVIERASVCEYVSERVQAAYSKWILKSLTMISLQRKTTHTSGIINGWIHRF